MAITRATSSRLLPWGAAICFVLGNLGVWAHQVVCDRLGFRETAPAIFDEPAVQERVAQQAVAALAGETGDTRPMDSAFKRRLIDALAVRLATNVLRAMHGLALGIGIPAGIVALFALVASGLVGDQLIVQVAARVVMTRLLTQCVWLMLAAFGLYWLGKATGWLGEIDQQLRGIEQQLMESTGTQ